MKHTYGSYSRAQDVDPYFSARFKVKDHETTSYTRRLLVDNRDRVSGTPFDFEVRFGNPFVNAAGVTEYEGVKSVNIKMAALPKVADEPYVVLDIEKLNDSALDATDNTANRAFAVAYFVTSLVNASDIKPSKDFYSQKVVFQPPLSKLDRLRVWVRKANGDLVSLTDTNTVDHVSMLLQLELLK